LIGTKQLSHAAAYAIGHGLTGGTDGRLQSFRDQRVRALVAHAYEFVPYYRALMDRNRIRPQDIQSVADLAHFPISRKDDFQGQSVTPFLDRRVDKTRLILHKTSGSTGQPLQIYRNWGEERIYGAYRWSVMAQYGYRPTARHAELEELQPQRNGDNRLLHRAAAALGLFRQQRIQALQEPEAICREIGEFRPTVLSGYAGVLLRAAVALPDAIRDRLNLRFVAAHSDKLTAPMVQCISEAFRAPVFELYDAYETNVLAWQCPEHNVLHTADACAVVDLVDGSQSVGEGECGEVVLTALHSYSMPFIRYAIGDLATRAPRCPCGRASAALRSVDGRTVEYFALDDGRVLHPYELYAAIPDNTWIRQYQLLQLSLQSFRLDVVLARPVSDGLRQESQRRVAALLGEGTDFHINIVTRLGSGKERKLRAFRSLVESPPQG
jgi:phenylacetate-CoA ligase